MLNGRKGEVNKTMSKVKLKFSIIVPIYNVEEYLKQCLDSILSQTYSVFELILVNDGSTDGCGKICKEYCAKDDRIVLINQENCGLLAARRVGIKAATGDYIIHVDSDDYVKNILLERLYDEISKTKCDLLLYGYSLTGNDGNTLKSISFDELSTTNEYITREELIRVMLTGPNYNSIWAKCAKKMIVDSDADYSIYGRLMMWEDLFQSIPLIEKADKICVIKEPLYIYRVLPGSMSRQIRRDYIYHFITVFDRLYNLILNCCTDDSTLQRFYCYYYHNLTRWLILSTIVYSRNEYRQLVEKIKPYIIPVKNGYHRFSSFADQVCYQLAIYKRYYVCKSVAHYLTNRKR